MIENHYFVTSTEVTDSRKNHQCIWKTLLDYLNTRYSCDTKVSPHREYARENITLQYSRLAIST